MSHHIIRRVRLAHCKRGPEVCPQCRTMDVERICLLDVDPPDAGLQQRCVIEIEIDGQPTWREFDIVRTFESEGEARRYAGEGGSATSCCDPRIPRASVPEHIPRNPAALEA